MITQKLIILKPVKSSSRLFLKVQQYVHHTRVNGMGQKHKINSRLTLIRIILLLYLFCFIIIDIIRKNRFLCLIVLIVNTEIPIVFSVDNDR